MHCFTESRGGCQRRGRARLPHLVFGHCHVSERAELRRSRGSPLERLLVETDSPYLAPVPHRGKRNQPAYVPHVAAEIARLRGLQPEDIARATTANFFRLFGIEALGAHGS